MQETAQAYRETQSNTYTHTLRATDTQKKKNMHIYTCMCKLALQWEAKKKDMCLGVLGGLLPESLLIFLLLLTTTNSNPIRVFFPKKL